MSDNYTPRCPLPVLRFVYDEDGNDGPPEVQVCGGMLLLTHAGLDTFYCGQAVPQDADAWKVECDSGHVLFVQDDEGNDRLSSLPYDNAQAVKVIESLAHWVEHQ